MGYLIGLVAMTLGAAAPAAAEREVQIAGPSGPLKGALRTAGEEAPVVVIVPGSGPTDRDGNNPLGVRAASYRMLAEELSTRGVASLRIDKRGMFSSSEAVPDANKATIGDYAADVRLWAAEAARLSGTGCAWVAGHSEGALVALAAAQDGERLCGIILIAGIGRPMAVVLREQLRANPANAPLLPDALAAISTLEKGGSVDVSGFAPPLQVLFNPDLQPYLRGLFSHDPVKLARAHEGAMMIVHGGRDLQVARADADALAAARPDARLHVVADANHVLKSVPDDRAANLASYANPDLPLAPGVADAIAAFIFSGGR